MIGAMVAALVILVGMFGGSIASFLCVVAERSARGESIGGRSHCACGRKLKAHENVPVVGWLATRGTARCCGSRLPLHYVGWEAGFFLAYAASSVLLLGDLLDGEGASGASIVYAALSVVALPAALLLVERKRTRQPNRT